MSWQVNEEKGGKTQILIHKVNEVVKSIDPMVQESGGLQIVLCHKSDSLDEINQFFGQHDLSKFIQMKIENLVLHR